MLLFTNMITKEDIQNLADLARIEVNSEEIESLRSEIDSILGYVGRIKEISGEIGSTLPKLRNVMRDDVVTHKPGEYTEDLLSLAPSREKNFLKVKKILE